MYCKNCGTIQSIGAVFCPSCGKRFPEIKRPVEFDNGSMEFYIAGVPLTIESHNFEISDMIIDVSQYFVEKSKELTKFLSHNLYFDSLIEKGIPYFIEAVGNAFASIHTWLCLNDVCDITQEAFIGYAVSKLDIENDMSVFQQIADAVSDYVNKINSERMVQRTSRGRWCGGGLGFAGAIKGAITSGMLNWGTDILHSIGDSYVDSRDADKIRQFKVKVGHLIDSLQYLSELFFTYFMKGIQAALYLYGQRMPNLPRNYADFDILNPIADISETLKRVHLANPGNETIIQKYFLSLITRISNYPFDVEPYIDMIETLGAEPDELETILEWMHMDDFYETAIKLRARRYAFDLENGFSDMSRQEKRNTVDSLGRLVLRCSRFYNADDLRQIYYSYSDKLKSIGI